MSPPSVMRTGILLTLLVMGTALSPDSIRPEKFPYAEAGLTERQAAAHLLNRFTYGPTPNQVDEVVALGLEKWFTGQLEAKAANPFLTTVLKGNDAVEMSTEQIVNTYIRQGSLKKMAIAEGVVSKDSINRENRKANREKMAQYLVTKGFKVERQLIRQFEDQKILRSRYSENQLEEVMTSFWFNHFNVSFTKNTCTLFIPTYEREVIRPHSLGNFEELLIATAKSPAMLIYLDNFSSTGDNRRLSERKASARRPPKGNPKKKFKGLNENYAREVMELHTLGVDGGYSQADVTEAARVFTGWTVFPRGPEHKEQRKLLETGDPQVLKKRGVVIDGDFLFTPNRHDDSAKTVLGHRFAASGGYEEGVTLLGILARHLSTARFISRKIAVRFVSDEPPESLVNRLTEAFTSSQGNIKSVLWALASAPEFWSETSVRQKTKSPFELTMSAMRSLRAEITEPARIAFWLNRMGEKIYYYMAPTGYPDRAQYWINTGSLLTRMNFGLALATGNIPGIRMDLMALNNNHEPESSSAALSTYLSLLLPERKQDETIQRLTPLLNDPQLQKKISTADVDKQVAGDPMSQTDSLIMEAEDLKEQRHKSTTGTNRSAGNKYQLAQVVGIILGSPEFQRR